MFLLKLFGSLPFVQFDVGEALDLYYAITRVNHLRLQNVDFRLDSKKVVDNFHRVRHDIIEFESILKACKIYCNLHLQNSHVKFSRMQANEVPHAIAQVAAL
jgi:hypothetical protein